MCTLGISTWLSIDFYGENNLILAFIHATLYSKTKTAFPFRQNPAKHGLTTTLTIRYYLPKYYQIKRSLVILNCFKLQYVLAYSKKQNTV